MPAFEVKLAQTPEEVAAAQRLRFEVFNVEMKKGLQQSRASGLDADEYDGLCDHLLIIDRKKGLVIGTYRFLLRSRLGEGGRFYSEGEFDLSNIRRLKGEILEMGRSCVHKDYRRNSIVHLLWNGIVQYLAAHQVAYIIGCPSLYVKESGEISEIYALLKKDYFAPEDLRVSPHKKNALEGLREDAAIDGNEKKVLLRLPALVRSYLKVGAVVCGAPAVDHEFGTVDLFMLLDVAKISTAYLNRLRIANF